MSTTWSCNDQFRWTGYDEFVGGMWVNIIDILLSGLRLVTDVEISWSKNYITFVLNKYHLPNI